MRKGIVVYNVQKLRALCPDTPAHRPSIPTNTEPKHALPSPASNTPGNEACHSPPAMLKI